MLKAFYDPQDDQDRAMLTERLDEIEADIRNGDADEDELAELRDMNDNLTDDTRYRVQDLMRRMEGMTEGKSAKGDVIYGQFGGGGGDGPTGDVGDWYTSQTYESEGESVTADNFYRAYQEWCSRGGFAPLPEDEFHREVRLYCLTGGGDNIRRERIAGAVRYIGVALKSMRKSDPPGAHGFYK